MFLAYVTLTICQQYLALCICPESRNTFRLLNFSLWEYLLTSHLWALLVKIKGPGSYTECTGFISLESVERCSWLLSPHCLLFFSTSVPSHWWWWWWWWWDGGGCIVPAKQLKSMYQIVLCIPLGEIRTLVAELLSLFFWFNHISFVSAYF